MARSPLGFWGGGGGGEEWGEMRRGGVLGWATLGFAAGAGVGVYSRRLLGFTDVWGQLGRDPVTFTSSETGERQNLSGFFCFGLS
ncbi:hypothetical protein E2562_010338 [Oryza meyeriana var. granulata]|uniref:Uncharacterized protein n=1 Tax=Oryza meyeriana var. granulata TaxID=110450 RepID=A0A6G1F6E1_9ORYZ|nr:hypothetical protein E2562_010338 [Oryza meyeriana var. granulata]